MDRLSPLKLASGRLTFRAVDHAAQAITRLLDIGETEAAAIFTHFDAATVMTEAEALDGDAARRDAPLAGLLVAIKDLFDEAGAVTRAGSIQLAGAAAATADATVIARLRAAGAICFGRTNMSEFAYSGVGLNPHFGTPGNSHDPERIPGGSTSGGAIAVAYGIADAALGSDTGGSIRIPAAFNALAGFKPTQSAVPLAGTFPLSGSYDSIGPIAPDIATCAALHAALSASAPPKAALPKAETLKLGVLRNVVTDGMDHQVTADFAAAMQTLSSAGVALEDVAFAPLAQAGVVNRLIVADEAHATHHAYLADLETTGDPRVLKRIRAAESFAPGEVDRARATRQEAIAAFTELASQYDAFLAPTVPIVPPTIAEVEADFDRLNALILRNPSTINFLDGCAATVPMHEAGDLPTGLMIIGPGGADWRILAIAQTLEGLLADR
ncbi:amidase [Jiella sp. MQZ9-1]|uniref:Amidase n=1 Tax=Jiella flava TaxID=2816857 RepID=A0A939FW67_9HYPH|nr:amidase [Jiella flava]MBO0662580.1 amidase [Jiella flava]MCD2472951.1 amidase [Jiella flava]